MVNTHAQPEVNFSSIWIGTVKHVNIIKIHGERCVFARADYAKPILNSWLFRFQIKYNFKWFYNMIYMRTQKH